MGFSFDSKHVFKKTYFPTELLAMTNQGFSAHPKCSFIRKLHFDTNSVTEGVQLLPSIKKKKTASSEKRLNASGREGRVREKWL